MKDIISTKAPINPVIIGKIVGVYGVRGWVKIVSFTDKINDIFNYKPWFIWCKTRWKLLQIETWKLIGKKYIVKFIDFKSREFAMLFNQSDLVIDRSNLPSLYTEEYYWIDIIGCKVITVQGNNVGYVVSIIETGAHDVLVVKINSNNLIKTKNCLIPFILNKTIKHINVLDNTVIIDWDVWYEKNH